MAELEEDSNTEPPIKAIPTQDASSNEAEQTTKDGPTTPQCPKSQPSPQHQYHSNNATQPPDKLWRKWDTWKRVLEVGAFLLGLFFAWIYHGQWKEMKKTTQATQKAVCVASRSLQETINNNNIQQAANDASFKAALDNFHKDQRAWISFSDVDLSQIQPGAPIRLALNFINLGKTPAVDVSFGGEAGMTINVSRDKTEINKKIAAVEKGMKTSKGPVIVPQQVQSFIVDSRDPDVMRRIKGVKDGLSNLYIVGRIDYRDVSKKKQWMTFCLRVLYDNGTPVWRYCQNFNDMSY